MNTENEAIILAIDRAENDIVVATELLRKRLNITTKNILLINSRFKNSPAYQGNETEGFFEEIVLDFSDINKINDFFRKIGNTSVIVHCRMEEAIKDLQIVIPHLVNAHVQTVESLTLSTEKTMMRKAIFDKYPEISPRFVVIESIDDFNQKLVEHLTFPVIIKPNGLHSSLLVSKCNDFEELEKRLSYAFNEIETVHHRTYGTGEHRFLIEEFIRGEMYSIDAYSNQLGEITCLPPIRVISSADVGRDGYYCYRTKTSTVLSIEDIRKANECVSKSIDALKLVNTTAHVELYNTAEGWKIVEVGPRIGGNRQRLYGEAYDINHFYNDLLVHYGKTPDIQLKFHRFAGGFNIYADSEGIVTKIKGFKDARNLPSVVRLDLNTKVGSESVFASKGGAFLADGIFSNDDEQTLEEDISKMRKLLTFEVEPN